MIYEKLSMYMYICVGSYDSQLSGLAFKVMFSDFIIRLCNTKMTAI